MSYKIGIFLLSFEVVKSEASFHNFILSNLTENVCDLSSHIALKYRKMMKCDISGPLSPNYDLCYASVHETELSLLFC